MAKKKEVDTSGKSPLDLAMDKLNTKFGTGSVLTLDSASTEKYDIIPTGSVGFDHTALGIGGFARGKMYELMGWEGSGKSTICAHATAEAQKLGGKVVYIDGEHAFDKKYFKAIGVNVDELILAQPSCGEEGFQIAMDLISTGEIALVIIDSDSSLIPKKVLDGDVGDSSIGRKALLNSNAYPKLKAILSRNNTCVIVVSQYREKIGVMFGNPTTTQGGHALKFYADCRIEVTKSLLKDGDQVIGATTKIKTTKNKMHPPYLLTDFEILYGKGIDKVGELINLLNEFELIRKYGGIITYHPTGEKFPLEKFREMLEDEGFNLDLKDLLIAKLKE